MNEFKIGDDVGVIKVQKKQELYLKAGDVLKVIGVYLDGGTVLVKNEKNRVFWVTANQIVKVELVDV